MKPASVIRLGMGSVLLPPQDVGLTCRGVASAKTEADADTQLTVFDSSAFKKQLLIFLSFKP